MMYCPTRRVFLACVPVERLVEIGGAATPPVTRDSWKTSAKMVGVSASTSAKCAADTSAHRAADHSAVETMALLEAAAIALGAGDLTADCIGAARAADGELRVCRHDPVEAMRWARLFHDTLLNSCSNRHMLDLIDTESLHAGGASLPPEIGVDELSRVADDHEQILDMITSGVPRSELERSLRRHAGRSPLCALAPPGR